MLHIIYNQEETREELMKKNICIVCISLFMGLSMLSGCTKQEEPTEVVWYIKDGDQDWIPRDQCYKELSIERIDAFNERVKELGENIKLVIKTYPGTSNPNDKDVTVRKQKLQNILEKDPNIDVIQFDNAFLSELEPLDTYLETEQGRELAQQVSQKRLDTLKVDGSLYHFPLSLFPLETLKLNFMESYYMEHKEELDPLLQSPKDLLTYFLQHYELQEGQLLAQRFYLYSLINASYVSIPSTPFYVRRADNKVINPYREDDILEYMKLFSELRYQGFTGKGLSDEEFLEIIRSNSFVFSSSIGFPKKYDITREGVITLDIGEWQYCYTSGFSILKSSDQKDAAFTLMKIMNTDKESANILQYGVNPKKDADGKVVSSAHMPSGTWNKLGNNMISDQAQGEPDHKQEYFRSEEENADIREQKFPIVWNFTGIEEQVDILNNLPDIDYRVNEGLANSYTMETTTDEFMKKIEQIAIQLEEAGADEVMEQLQKQVDAWVK